MASIANIIDPSRQCLLLGLLCFGMACRLEPDSPPRRSQRAPTTPQPAKIDWSMTRVEGEKALRIEYRVTNVTDRRIYLCDIIHHVENGAHTISNPQPIAVMNDAEPRVIRFMRGRVPSLASPTVPYLDPGSRPIDPGQTVSGFAQVPLPLEAIAWAGSVDPLKRWPKAAVLELGFFRVEPHWVNAKLADGGTLPITTWSDPMDTLRSDIKPLP